MLSERSERPKPQRVMPRAIGAFFKGFSNRMLDTTVALMSAK